MSLESKTIYELRGIAQANDIEPDWAWDKAKLMRVIRAKTAPKPPPVPKVSDIPLKETTGGMVSQSQLVEALKHFNGLIVTFPTPDSWQLNHNKRQDSGSLNIPMHAIMDCAKRIME